MFSLEELSSKGSPVHVNKLNMTISELINMYVALPGNVKLITAPKRKHSFHWSNTQKSRLIESIFLGLPVPEIFILDLGTGELQLIDGVQRLYTTIQFINSSILDLKPLVIQRCELIPELNGKSFKDLPLHLQLTIKRSSFGVNILIVKHKSNKTPLDLQNELIMQETLIQRLTSFNFSQYFD